MPSRSTTARLLLAGALVLNVNCALGAGPVLNGVAGDYRVLNDNGAWSWFMDERALVDGGQLLVGSVRAIGRFEQSSPPGWGNVELSTLSLSTGAVGHFVLHPHFEQDDHNAPGLITLADGRYLAAWTKHGQESRIYWRISSHPGDASAWGPIHEQPTPGAAGTFRGDSVTYCNPFRLTSEPGQVYLLHRGVGLDPNYLVSDDDGRTWRYGGKLLVGRDGYSPYLKYASNGRDTIHFVATEDHPRNFDNSLYHGFLRGGQLHRSDGAALGPLTVGTNSPYRVWDFTPVHRGGPTNVAWMCDVALARNGGPVVLFTTQRDGAGLPMGAGGLDHRFHRARWDGTRWQAHEIAFAGTRLYPGEDDYTGLGAIDPRDPDIIYISTDADPATGKPLISRANYRRHHELFRGRTTDQGRTWKWSPVTVNSTTDNLRPLVPRWDDPAGRTMIVWMRGAYRVNRGEWSTAVVATVLRGDESPEPKQP